MEVVVTLSQVAIDRIEAHEYTVPTDYPESDGTLQWKSTTLVLVHAHGGNKTGHSQIDPGSVVGSGQMMSSSPLARLCFTGLTLDQSLKSA
jgi:uncharacterized Rossmann fold enzyme